MIESRHLGYITLSVFIFYIFIILTFSDLGYGKKLFIVSGFLIMVLVALGFELFSKTRKSKKKKYILYLSATILLGYLIVFVLKLV